MPALPRIYFINICTGLERVWLQALLGADVHNRFEKRKGVRKSFTNTRYVKRD